MWGGYYEEASLIWRSRWVTVDNAVVECREALALPTKPGRAVILRQVIARQGAAHVEVILTTRGVREEPLRKLARTNGGTGAASSRHADMLGGGGGGAPGE